MPWVLSKKSSLCSALAFVALRDAAPSKLMIYNWKVLRTGDDLQSAAPPLCRYFIIYIISVHSLWATSFPSFYFI